jgi:hypothetical protein
VNIWSCVKLEIVFRTAKLRNSSVLTTRHCRGGTRVHSTPALKRRASGSYSTHSRSMKLASCGLVCTTRSSHNYQTLSWGDCVSGCFGRPRAYIIVIMHNFLPKSTREQRSSTNRQEQCCTILIDSIDFCLHEEMPLISRRLRVRDYRTVHMIRSAKQETSTSR